ncbi:MAG TPA: glycosyltransferase [Bacteroidia bacterium]|jgi:glycosyltransferase involved in cell wall biosynthesis|nr:glycosyltransferase [Bacteroidia bacterium]
MKNILVITWWPFDDALIQTYTLPYLRIMQEAGGSGLNIFLITLEKNCVEGTVRKLDERLFTISLEYTPLNLPGIFKWRKKLKWIENFIGERKITHLHTWCSIPGGIGYVLKKRTGLPLIADSFEPHADPMVETGTWKKKSPSYLLLHHWEKKTAKHADVIIANSPAMQDYIEKQLGVHRTIEYVKPACVDPGLFSISKRKDPALMNELGFAGKKVLVYAGKFGGLYYKEETFRLFKAFYDSWKDDLRILLLSPESHDVIMSYAAAAGLPGHLIVHKFVKHAEIPAYLGTADVSLCPIIPTPSRRACSPIKNGEYWAMGLPLLICEGVSIDDKIVNENNAGYVLRAMTDAEFRNAVIKTDELLKSDPVQLVNRIRHIAEENRNFSTAERIYRKIYGNEKK